MCQYKLYTIWKFNYSMFYVLKLNFVFSIDKNVIVCLILIIVYHYLTSYNYKWKNPETHD